MSIAPGWRRLFRLPRFSRKAIEQDVDDELSFHLTMREEKLRRLGQSSENAQANALARFGDASRVREECLTIDRQYVREVRFMESVESVVGDARHALRTLRKSPAFTIVAVLTLALGVGATTAMFSLVDGILLRPLPYPEPQRLVRVLQSYPEKGLDTWSLSQENLAMYRDRMTDFSGFAGYARRGVTLDGNGPAERLTVALATGDFFSVLGVKPMFGRTFDRAEDRPRGANVIVLSYGFWQSHFAGDVGVVGRTIDLDGNPTRVIGVMPEGFAFPNPTIQAYLPLGLDPARRFGWFITGVGRLKPDVSVAHAARQATSIMWNWARTEPDLISAGSIAPEQTRMRVLVDPWREAMTGSVARPLVVLQAAVALLLLIAIANIATLLSSRSLARAPELAVRTALGATTARVARQLVTESVVLAIVGGTLGVALATVGVREFARWNTGSLPRLAEVSLNWEVLLFALGISALSGVLVGLSPALRVARSRRLADDLAGTHKQSVRASARRLNNALIVAQLALSAVLLVGAGLVLKSFQRLLHTDLGFDPRGVTAISLPLPMQKYMTRGGSANATEAIVERLRTLPGVRAASADQFLPYSGSVNTDGYLIEGHAPPPNAGAETQTIEMVVTPGFFDVMRIRLEHGRDFSISDDSGATPVAIVDDALARRYWHGADAVGKRMRVTGDTTWRTIVGVVSGIRDEEIAEASRPHMYTPLQQTPAVRPTIMIRSDDDPRTVLASVRRILTEMEPGAPIASVKPLTEVVSTGLGDRRLTEMLLAGFALLAVTLAAVGIYGVMSLYVANRKREFGIRLAVGAEPGTLVRLVMIEGLALAAMGVAFGLVGGLGAARWLRTLLYEVSPTDPVVFATLAVGLLAVALASCYAPARRAAKADPLVALRAD